MTGPEGGGAPPPPLETGENNPVAEGSKNITSLTEDPNASTRGIEGQTGDNGANTPETPASPPDGATEDIGKWEQELKDGGDPDQALRDFASETPDIADAQQAKQDALLDMTPDELNKLADEGDQDAKDILTGMNPSQTSTDTKPYDASYKGMRARLDAAKSLEPEDLQKAAAEGNVIAGQALRDKEKQVAQGAEDYAKQQAQTTSETLDQNPAQTPENPSTAQQESGATEQSDTAQNPENTSAESTDTTSEQKQPTTEQPDAESGEQPEQNDDNAEDTGDKKDKEKTPEEEAAELRLGRDKLVQELLKANPDMKLEDPAVQKFLDLAGENKENMSTMTEMAKQFIGPEAEKNAEKLGLDPKTYAEGSVGGIIQNIEQDLQRLKAELAKNPSAELQNQEKKSNWFVKLLHALLEIIKTMGAMAKAGMEAAMEQKKSEDKKRQEKA